jgi:hypothetical protein
MRAHRLILLALVLILSACSTTNSVPPLKSEFMDIPLPEGLAFIPDESVVIESETVRAARLVYVSEFEPGSLVVSIQSGLQQNGWRLLRSTSFPRQGTMQIYEKAAASLQVRIWEGGTFNSKTYVELSGSRFTVRSSATAATTIHE